MNPHGPTRFHRHHGSNIALDTGRITATRISSFANALTFSERPLAPGEIFLVEIEENETGWSGNMRIGLTQMNPNKEFPLPLYALPDLVSMGPSWLYAITKSHNSMQPSLRQRREDLDAAIEEAHAMIGDDDWGGGIDRLVLPPALLQYQRNRDRDRQTCRRSGDRNSPDSDSGDENAMIEDALWSYRRHPKVLQREGSLVRTPRGFIQLKALLPSISNTRECGGMSLLPTDIGSRIGVMYVPTSESKADMHFIINGEDQGPCARDIPYQTAPIFAVVDVYGSTKKVRVVQLHEVESLKSMCRDVILRSMRLSGVSNLPLPQLLKDYLLYNL